VILQRLQRPAGRLGIGLDNDAGIVCGKTVPEDGFDKQADGLEVREELVGL
jgi:hypothetical protein